MSKLSAGLLGAAGALGLLLAGPSAAAGPSDAASPSAAARIEAAAAADWIEGRVVRTFDGDTLELRVGERERLRIRLADIDTPERGQPWASRARQALAERVQGKLVRVNRVATDRYGRTVGEVYADDQCVGCELVRAGHAWVYRRFSDDPVLLALEAEARAAGRGLWGLPEAQRVPPWEWRRAHPRKRRGRRPPGEPVSASEAVEASEERDAPPGCAKRRCAEMASCAEARFALAHCGHHSLDGDGDGIPCEALCASDEAPAP